MESILSTKQIHKRYSGVHALRGVDFDLRVGEIHALVGENGAGKSTLMKILSGIVSKDSGEIFYRGQSIDPKTPREALDLGIGIIHQELFMMDHLTVAQNIFIGREEVKGLLLDEKALNKKTAELFKKLDVDLDPSTTCGDLTVGKQQLVEIAKAVSNNLRVLILDEPTAALTETEINKLFKIMRDLAKDGVAMIYISHRMNEINQIADRVTILRDGEYIATNNTSELTKEQIIRMMVGRIIFEEHKLTSTMEKNPEVVLKVRNLNAGHQVKNVSFDLHRGEVLGFAGLMGAGRTETARAIFGADEFTLGHIEINGRKVSISSPADAVEHGIAYLSEDRKRFGLAVDLSVSENAVLASYNSLVHGPIIRKKKIGSIVSKYVENLKIKTPSIYQLVRNLSGGNQQKVVLAKWLIKNSDIFIFDEPTRGIDVGAKNEIYKLMNDLIEKGKSIIMISSELPEILRMSDRVIVMCEGQITGELNIVDADQESIMHLATLKK